MCRSVEHVMLLSSKHQQTHTDTNAHTPTMRMSKLFFYNIESLSSFFPSFVLDFFHIIFFSVRFQMNSRDETEKTFKVAMPDNAYSTVYLRDAMSVEEFLANACVRRGLNPMEHFVRVKKRRDMEDHNYFVPHRNDLIENYVSILMC